MENKKARRAAVRVGAYRYKPICMLIFCLASCGIFPLATKLSLNVFSSYYAIFPAIGAFAVCAVLSFVFRRSNAVQSLVFLIVSIAEGAAVSSVFSHYSIELDLGSMLLASLLPCMLMAVLCILAYTLPRVKKISVISVCIIEAVMLGAAVAIMVITKQYIYGFSAFCMLLHICFAAVFGLTVFNDRRSVLRDLRVLSFGIFALVACVVVIILSEGDAADALDLCDDIEVKKKRKKP